MSSAYGNHTYDPPSTSDSVLKSQNGKVRNPCLLYCKDEASKLLEYITIPQQRIPTGYRKLSLDIPLVDKVVDPSPSLVDPTLPLKSEVKEFDPIPFLVDPTLPLESEVKVDESM